MLGSSAKTVNAKLRWGSPLKLYCTERKLQLAISVFTNKIQSNFIFEFEFCLVFMKVRTIWNFLMLRQFQGNLLSQVNYDYKTGRISQFLLFSLRYVYANYWSGILTIGTKSVKLKKKIELTLWQQRTGHSRPWWRWTTGETCSRSVWSSRKAGKDPTNLASEVRSVFRQKFLLS